MSSGTATHAKSPRPRRIPWIAVPAVAATVVLVRMPYEGGETLIPGEPAA